MDVNTTWIEQVVYYRLLDLSRKHVLPRITPMGWWECDMFCVTPSGYWSEYEIKISKSDFNHDFVKSANVREGKKYTKYQARRQKVPKVNKHERLKDHDPHGPSYYWFVAPQGLLDIKDVPDYAGLIEIAIPSAKTANPRYRSYYKVIKKAPRLHSNKISQERLDKISFQIPYRFQRAYFETIPKLKDQVQDNKDLIKHCKELDKKGKLPASIKKFIPRTRKKRR